jgi:hypothetical protein
MLAPEAPGISCANVASKQPVRHNQPAIYAALGAATFFLRLVIRKCG